VYSVDSVEDFINQLNEFGDATYSYVTVSELFRSGKTQLLYDIAFDEAIKSNPNWIHVRTIDRIISTFTLDGNETQIRLGLEIETKTRRYGFRVLTAMMAAYQPTEILLNVLRDIQHMLDEKYLEFAALLIQEMLIRGFDVTQHSIVLSYLDKLKEARHPLAALPLKLQSFESEIQRMLPKYRGDQGHTHGFPFGWNPGASPSSSTPIEVKEITTSFNSQLALSAFEDWTTRSNGIAEFWAFYSETELMVEALPSQILSLDAACLKDCVVADIVIGQTTPNVVFEMLFAAACNGGAYSGGVQGAYGRLQAWESFTSLMGSNLQTPPDQLDLLAKNCAWFLFNANSAWFHEYHFMDVGILVLHPDKQTLVLLAASDTD
jgi:hypothetical protein